MDSPELPEWLLKLLSDAYYIGFDDADKRPTEDTLYPIAQAINQRFEAALAFDKTEWNNPTLDSQIIAKRRWYNQPKEENHG